MTNEHREPTTEDREKAARAVDDRAPQTTPMLAVAGNEVSLLRDGRACFDAMLEAIAQARDEILLEMYWFGSGRIGRRFSTMLAQRAKEGLAVCVTYDAIGSWDADRSMFQAMAADGCRLYEFNPPRRLFRHCRLNLLQRRNHRKMLIVDGRVGITGGVNLDDAWAAISEGGIFHDDMIRIAGPGVTRMREIFLRTFGRSAGYEDKEPSTAREGHQRSRQAHHIPVRQHRARGRASRRQLGQAESLSILTNSGLRRRRIIEDAYLSAIRSAQRSILIVNSYFIPRRAIRRALADAVRRGVQVRVLVPGISDVAIAALASRRLYCALMRAGIELYEWRTSILHSKIATVDDNWCTIGTHNLDYRSLFYNLEVNVVIESTTVAATVAGHIRSDIALSTRVSPESWSRRPLVHRFLEVLFYRFRRLL